MRVQDVMTRDPFCCTRDSGLQEVARMMVEHDCGVIPVVDGRQNMKLIGAVTDRDITCRTVAVGKNPLEMTAAQCMSSPVVTARPDMSLDECRRLMEENQVRRIPVIDSRGACCGMVSQADIARKADKEQTAEVVKEVSKPTGTPSTVSCCGSPSVGR